MDLLGSKWTEGDIEFEVTSADEIKDLEHFETMYKGAFDTRCGKMVFEEAMFYKHKHTDECNDFYFCMVKETDKSVIIHPAKVEEGALSLEAEENIVSPKSEEVIYKTNWGHFIINKSGCFRFTSDNQKYPNNKEQQAAALEQYKNMIAVLCNVAKEKEGKAKKLHAQREKIRDEINKLELKLKKI